MKIAGLSSQVLAGRRLRRGGDRLDWTAARRVGTLVSNQGALRIHLKAAEDLRRLPWIPVRALTVSR